LVCRWRFFGAERIANRRQRWIGWAMLSIGGGLFFGGIADIPIAWLLGLLD
jgi:hypothetical protein